MKHEFVKTVFKQLDGKIARVSAGSLIPQSTLEGEVTLHWNPTGSLIMTASLEYGSVTGGVNPADLLKSQIKGVLDKDAFERNEVNKCVDKFFKETKFGIGSIYIFKVTNLNCYLCEEGNLQEVVITTSDSSITTIRLAKNQK